MKSSGKMPHRAGHVEKKTGDDGYISTRCKVWFWALLNVTTKAILVANRLLHSVKGMVGSHRRNWILGVRIGFIEPINPAAEQCLCCHHRRSRKADIFRLLPMASAEKAALLNLNVRYFVKNNFFCKGFNKNKGDCHNCRIVSFFKMSAFKIPFP